MKKKKKLRKDKIIAYKAVAVRRLKKGRAHVLGTDVWSPAIMKVEIPTDSRIVKPTVSFSEDGYGKFRTERVRVVEIRSFDGKRTYRSATNWQGARGTYFCYTLEYHVGKVAKADRLERSPSVQCGNGINCFLKKSEALSFAQNHPLRKVY